jgi:hypothetical protein
MASPLDLVMLTWMTRDALPWFLYRHGSFIAMVPLSPWFLYRHGSFIAMVPLSPWFLYRHGSYPETKTDSREQHPPSDPRHIASLGSGHLRNATGPFCLNEPAVPVYSVFR